MKCRGNGEWGPSPACFAGTLPPHAHPVVSLKVFRFAPDLSALGKEKTYVFLMRQQYVIYNLTQFMR
jgi:hypothetical protein